MSAYANSLEKPESFDSFVRKFRVICVTHELQTGSRDDLPLFLQKLLADRHLSMDFWGFVGKLSDRDGGELTDNQILAVILEGITHGEVPPDDPDLRQTIDDLRAMLAGVDVHGSMPIEPAPFPQNEPEPWNRPAHSSGSFAAAAPNGVVDETAAGAIILPQLDEALHRLELTNLELKHHLDEIDKRMSRLEPLHSESGATRKYPTENIPTPVAESRFARMEQLTRRSPSGRLILEPAVPPEDILAAEAGRLSPRVPLQDYTHSSGYGRAVFSFLLVVALAAGGFAGYRYRELLQQKFSSLVQQFQNRTTPANTTSTSDTPVEQPEKTQPAAEQPLRGTSTPPPVNAAATKTPRQTSPSRTAAQESASTRKSIADRVAAQASQTPPDGISSADLAGAVRVSPGVMDSHLVDSRVPAYPDSAKVAGVEGSVIMQAIISRDGRVKRIHVIQGDSRLRGPAADAVYKWRYRPYMIEGQPVDVATTITVDFDLDR